MLVIVDLESLQDEECAICMSSFSPEGNELVIQLSKCQHFFHLECINTWFKQRPSCPSCLRPYGVFTGTQPRGTMAVHHSKLYSCAGYPDSGIIQIVYSFPGGIQGPEHPNPGHGYSGTRRTAYLPDNEEGGDILRLLRIAFERRLIFKVGTSITSGQENTTVWGCIHHKTTTFQGAFGYPDETYFTRVRDELAALGVS